VRRFAFVLPLALTVAGHAHADTADEKFIAACGSDVEDASQCEPVSTERARIWTEAADLYEAAFNADPNAQTAGHAALRAAFAATQSGGFARAIQDYERLLTTYGSESALRQVQSDAVRYAERLGFVAIAYERKAALQQAAFAFADASATYRAMATNARLDLQTRRNAAAQAMNLDAALSRRDLVVSMQRMMISLRPSDDERLRAAFLVATIDRSFGAFYDANKNVTDGSRYLIEAAWQAANTSSQPAAQAAWRTKVVAAWDTFHAHDARSAESEPYSSHAAEAAYALTDQAIPSRYDAFTRCIFKTYAADLGDVQTWEGRLASVERFRSVAVTAKSLARRGQLYRSLRMGMYYCGGSGFSPLTAQQTQAVATMRASGRADLIDLADDIEVKAKLQFRRQRDAMIDQNDARVVRFLCQATVLARSIGRPPPLDAIAKLAFIQDLIGEAAMRGYVEQTPDPLTAGKYLHYTPGMFARR